MTGNSNLHLLSVAKTKTETAISERRIFLPTLSLPLFVSLLRFYHFNLSSESSDSILDGAGTATRRKNAKMSIRVGRRALLLSLSPESHFPPFFPLSRPTSPPQNNQKAPSGPLRGRRVGGRLGARRRLRRAPRRAVPGRPRPLARQATAAARSRRGVRVFSGISRCRGCVRKGQPAPAEENEEEQEEEEQGWRRE